MSEKELKKNLVENIETISSGEDWPDSDFPEEDHPYHIVYDHNGNKVYDGHMLLLKHLRQMRKQ